jgi:single-strand DNA-binding protein
LTYTNNGTALGKFGIAVNKEFVSNGEKVKEVSFFDITQWGKGAEVLAQYLKKGKQVLIEGELKQDRWEKDGKTISKVCVTAKSIQLLGGGQGKESSSSERYNPDGSVPF